MVRALRRLAPLAPPVAATLFLLSGLFVGANPDTEEYRNAILTVVLHARALLEGQYPYWTSALGFGLPHPMHPAFLLHPLMPLFGLLDPEAAARLLYATHAALGASGCWWLMRRLGTGPWIAGLAACTWTLSAPSQNYVLTDFWPTEFIGWSLAPYVFLFAVLVLEPRREGQPWLDAVAFGLVSGLMWSNGHAGHVPVFFATLAVLVVAEWRRTVRVMPALVVATLVGAIIAAPTLARLFVELGRFPDLPRLTNARLLGWSDLVDMVMRPITFDSAGSTFAAIMARGARVPFFGGPMLIMAVASVAGLAGTTAWRRGLSTGFVVAFALMMASGLDRLGVISGMILFRDPMILLGIVLGGLAWQWLSTRRPRTAITVGVLQLTVLAVSAWPFEAEAWGASSFTARFLKPTGVAASLAASTGRIQGRWYLAPQLDELIRRGYLLSDGVEADLWVFQGLPIVNGTFKGVSADPMYPSGTLPLGRIEGHAATVSSASTLSVLGIGGILATATEPVAEGLEEVARVETRDQGPLRLLRNPAAWPGAAFVDDAVRGIRLEPLDGCDLGGVLCLDFSPVTAAKHDTAVQLTRTHGALLLEFQPDPARRWLLVSEMYRRQWTASAGGNALPVAEVFGGLIGVEVPPGVGSVELRYEPTLLRLLTWLSGATLVGAAIALVVLSRRSPRTQR